MVLTIAGQRRSRHAILLQTGLQNARIRIYKARSEDLEPGQPLTLTLYGTPMLTGIITAVQRDYRHWIIDGHSKVLYELATETVSAINGDSRKPSEIAPDITPAMIQFDGSIDIVLPRWGCRNGRTRRWALESLINTIGARTGQQVTWRFDPRQDLIIVEPNRDAWTPMDPPGIKPRRREGAEVIYPAVDLQPGDLIAPDGPNEQIEMVSTLWRVRKQYSRCRVVRA